MEIRKTIIPAASFGTRFLPITRVIPQEMLPLFNKPAIHHIVEEAIAAHVPHCFIVTNASKHAIADYFDSVELSGVSVSSQHEKDFIAASKLLEPRCSCVYLRQTDALGVGHAVLLAKQCLGKEYFCIALPDEIIDAKEPVLSQLMRVARQEKTSVIAVQEIPLSSVSEHSIIDVKKAIAHNLFQINGIVDRPDPRNAPSNLAIVGRYVVSSKLISALEYSYTFSEKGEVSLHDSIIRMMHNNERVFAYKIQGTRYSLNTPLGLLRATIALALKDPVYAPHVRGLLKELEQTKVPVFNPARMVEELL
jgi:UTP--glucose-1-phosphate uridylyltransferase